MLTDVILGSGFDQPSLNARQLRDFQGEMAQIVYDLVRDCQANPTRPDTSYEDAYAAVVAEMTAHHTPIVQGWKFETEALRADELRHRISSSSSEAFWSRNRFYVGLKDKAIEGDFQMVIDHDPDGPALRYRLMNQAGPIAQAQTDKRFKGLNAGLGKYWAHMSKAANNDIGINAVAQFDRVRQELHMGSEFYFASDLERGGIIIGNGLERPLMTLMAHALPDPRNPFPRIITSGYERVRGYTV